jgi:hypothetical protein
LFSAAELSAKAILLSVPLPDIRGRVTHNLVRDRFAAWAALGNAEPSHADILTRLANMRKSARYLLGDELILSREDAEAVFKTVADMYLGAVAAARPRLDALVDGGRPTLHFQHNLPSESAPGDIVKLRD